MCKTSFAGPLTENPIEVFLTEYDEEKQRIIEEKEREEELRESWEAGEQNGIRKGE